MTRMDRQPVTRKPTSSVASPSWSRLISSTYSPGGSAASGRSICCSPGRGDGFGLQLVHRRAGAVEQVHAQLGRRPAGAVGRYADQQMLDPVEFAAGDRHRVGVGAQLLEFPRRSRAQDGRRAENRLRRRQIRHADLAGLAVEHLRRGAFDGNAQLDFARRHVEADARRPAGRGRCRPRQRPARRTRARRRGPCHGTTASHRARSPSATHAPVLRAADRRATWAAAPR